MGRLILFFISEINNVKMKIIIPLDGQAVNFEYKREEIGLETILSVRHDNDEIARYTSKSFEIKFHNRDNILSFPVKGPTDQAWKYEIVGAIFKKEKIN